jgi:hypothetical protein
VKTDHPLYKYSFDLVANEERTEFSLIVDLGPVQRIGDKRIRIPLPQGFVERLTDRGWECDNLDYIEAVAKQKGLL